MIIQRFLFTALATGVLTLTTMLIKVVTMTEVMISAPTDEHLTVKNIFRRKEESLKTLLAMCPRYLPYPTLMCLKKVFTKKGVKCLKGPGALIYIVFVTANVAPINKAGRYKSFGITRGF